MAHTINGIITSFKYKGELPNVILVGNYHLIPLDRHHYTQIIPPYEEFTKDFRKCIKDLSFKGKCAYIETDFFGGPGIQIAEVWEQGKRIEGPFIAYHDIKNPKIPESAIVVDEAINKVLQILGVYKDEGKDEFDSVRLGWYRSNDEIIEEYTQNCHKK